MKTYQVSFTNIRNGKRMKTTVQAESEIRAKIEAIHWCNNQNPIVCPEKYRVKLLNKSAQWQRPKS